MRILTYGLSTDKLAGIETFLLNMNQFMSEDMIFDYVIEGDYTIHQERIDKKGGKCFFIAPKRKMISNVKDWCRVLKENKQGAQTVYFNMYSLAWIVPVFLAKIYGYRVVIHAHNNNLHQCGFILKSLHQINKQLLNLLKITRFTNSSLSAKFFFGKQKKAEMIYCAIDTERFNYDENMREKIRKDLNVQDKHVYGFSGRLAYQKNPLFLIRVFKEIAKLDSAATFIVCGDGDLADETRKLAAELGINVLFMGNVSNVEHYYQAMDCFVLPSRFEGLGIVLIEAQCAGLPCVASAEVIPTDAKVTELLKFISLDKDEQMWAELCLNGVINTTLNRAIYSKQVEDSSFNIKNEACKLENCLRQKK